MSKIALINLLTNAGFEDKKVKALAEAFAMREGGLVTKDHLNSKISGLRMFVLQLMLGQTLVFLGIVGYLVQIGS